MFSRLGSRRAQRSCLECYTGNRLVLFFAYDGSLGGSWVAHYAVRFAATTAARRLHLVHVHEAGGPHAQVLDRMARIGAECALLGVALETELIASPLPAGSAQAVEVASRILDVVPPGAMVLAGARAKARAGALLAGTVSARLLAARQVSVVAIRVVHPGALGQPGRVLLPVVDRAGFVAGALPVLRMLAPDLEHLHLALIHQVSSVRARFQSTAAAQELVGDGRRRLLELEAEVRAGLAPHQPLVDSSVALAPDSAREIVLQAARHRARLICLDAAYSPRLRALRALSTETMLERVLRDAPADVAIFRSVRSMS